jgi:hypothetical protein
MTYNIIYLNGDKKRIDRVDLLYCIIVRDSY